MGFLQDAIGLEILRHPWLLRTGLGLTRQFRPVLSVGSNVIVSSSSAVREVLARDEDFLSGVLYAPKMKLGPFVLGMDRTDQYLAERAALVRAIQDKTDRFARSVAMEAKAAAAALPRGGGLDLVATYVEPVVMRSASRLYGVSTQGAKSRYVRAREGDATFALWMRKLGAVIGSASPAPFGLEALSLNIAQEVLPHLREAVFAHRQHKGFGDPPTVIGSLLADTASPLDDEGIVRSIGGMMSAGATICKAFVHALHALLQRPSELRETIAAAASQDIDTVRAYQWEALRFQPVFPLLVRYCPKRVVIGADGPHSAAVGTGSTVVVAPIAAMFDPAVVEAPESFRTGRPSHNYMHFGDGQHRCIGEWLASVALPTMFAALSEVPGFAHTAPGRISYDGPAIARYDMKLPRRSVSERPAKIAREHSSIAQ